MRLWIFAFEVGPFKLFCWRTEPLLRNIIRVRVFTCKIFKGIVYPTFNLMFHHLIVALHLFSYLFKFYDISLFCFQIINCEIVYSALFFIAHSIYIRTNGVNMFYLFSDSFNAGINIYINNA